MYGFNVTRDDFSYDNRPVAPLFEYSFDKWWMHGHLEHPPNPGDIFNLPAGSSATAEIACNKGATSYFASSEGGNIIDPNNPNTPCPNSDSIAFHAINKEDAAGCALAIAYESDVSKVKPEDLVVFSVRVACTVLCLTCCRSTRRVFGLVLQISRSRNVCLHAPRVAAPVPLCGCTQRTAAAQKVSNSCVLHLLTHLRLHERVPVQCYISRVRRPSCKAHRRSTLWRRPR